MCGGAASGDDPRPIVPDGVDEDEYPAECVCPDGHEPLFIRLVVYDGNGHGIVKHGFGVREVNTMLPQIALALGRIPFEPHRRSICMIVHTRKSGGLPTVPP